ncbi:MAG: hypothetical protein E3J72_14935 [Planctomycetota bacterium]|nr:MAG: hypothetical protein E3J72_14935 [Planctomycetota bacterium]
MPKKTNMFLGLFIFLVVITALCIHGCDIGVGTKKVPKKAKKGTAVAVSTTGKSVLEDTYKQASSSLDDEEDKEEDKPREPMDTSTLKWYFKNVRVGDWVKYWTSYKIENWEVKAISGERATIEKHFYADSGKPIRKPWKTTPNLLGWDDRTDEDMVINKKNGKIEHTEAEINGKKMKLTIVCSRDRNAQIGSIDMYSFSAPLEGRVLSVRNDEVSLRLLDYGNAKDKAGMKVKAGDHKKAIADYKEPTDPLVIGWTNLIEQVCKDLRQWDSSGGGSNTKKPIKDKDTPLVKMTDAAKKKADSLKCPAKGIRPGNWVKVLVRKDHIQIWLITEVTEEGYTFYRRFYNNREVLYNIEKAPEKFKDNETMWEQKMSNADGTWEIYKDKPFVLADTGKEYESVRFDRKYGERRAQNWHINETKISNGRVFSQHGENIWLYVIDFGQKPDAERMKVKKGDVRKALENLDNLFPSQNLKDSFHEKQINRWKDELRIYLDILNGILKRAGRKQKKVNRDYDPVDIDAGGGDAFEKKKEEE